MAGLRILYADDEGDIQWIVKVALESRGWEVSSCDSGFELLKIVSSFQPDLILLDVMMPGMDGPSVLKQLRQSESTRDIPVIFVTAKVQKHEISYFKSLGVLDVIAKPFDPMTLGEQIKEIWAKVSDAE